MKSHVTLISCFILICTHMPAQDSSNLPYSQIPDYPETYTAGNVAARIVDGLGFRYYWATEGLSEQDLEFKPSPDARTTGETVDHILGLSRTLVNSVQSKPNLRVERAEISFVEKRQLTLANIEMASQILKADGPDEMEGYKIIFQRGDNSSEFPFWNMLNGPLSDAIYHTGQIVSFRRSYGNPINPNVGIFMGKLRE